jgi:hypothetical protein
MDPLFSKNSMSICPPPLRATMASVLPRNLPLFQ